MPAMPILLRAVLVTIVLSAAVYDLRFRRIPNWLNLSGLILGFGLNLFFFQWHGALSASQGLLMAMAFYLPLYLLRGMGAGDVKLMAAVGSLVGPSNWLQIFIATALVGGAAAAIFALVKRRFTETCVNLYFLLKDLLHLKPPHRTNPQLDFRNPASLRMPHGVLIAVGSVVFIVCVSSEKDLVSDLLSGALFSIF